MYAAEWHRQDVRFEAEALLRGLAHAFRVPELAGLRVTVEDLPDRTGAVYANRPGVIVLSTSRCGRSSREDATHELAHLLQVVGRYPGDGETFANMLAADVEDVLTPSRLNRDPSLDPLFDPDACANAATYLAIRAGAWSLPVRSGWERWLPSKDTTRKPTAAPSTPSSKEAAAKGIGAAAPRSSPVTGHRATAGLSLTPRGQMYADAFAAIGLTGDALTTALRVKESQDRVVAALGLRGAASLTEAGLMAADLPVLRAMSIARHGGVPHGGPATGNEATAGWSRAFSRAYEAHRIHDPGGIPL